MIVPKKTVLIGCEYSGIIREEFSKAGWNAWSCDLLPTESNNEETKKKHIQIDVSYLLVHEEINYLKRTGQTRDQKYMKVENCDYLPLSFDLLIACPPCTYLTYSGTAIWFDDGRTMKRIEAAKFFMQLYDAPIKHICIENPRGIMTQIFRKPDMEIHPYYFGDNEMKRTNLWLKNLPKLNYQMQPDLFNQTVTATQKTGQIKKRYTTDALNGKKFKNGHERSRFYPSIAKAMAE